MAQFPISGLIRGPGAGSFIWGGMLAILGVGALMTFLRTRDPMIGGFGLIAFVVGALLVRSGYRRSAAMRAFRK